MRKSYHSMVVPIVEAMTALRRFALCSDADSVPYVAVVAIGVPPGRFLFPRGRALSGPFAEARITEREGGSKPSESDAREKAITRCATTFPRQRDFPSNHWAPGNRHEIWRQPRRRWLSASTSRFRLWAT